MRRGLGSAAIAAAVLGGTAAPALLVAPIAAAHSALISVSPEDGAQLDASPEEVVLTFNEEVNQSFATIAVTGQDNRENLAEGEPTVDGPVVSSRVSDLEPGTYTVGYRITSADGHVVSGSSTFTLAGDAVAAEEGAEDAPLIATPGASADPTTDAASESTADSTDAESGVNPVIWVVGGLAVLLVAGAVVVLRRKP